MTDSWRKPAGARRGPRRDDKLVLSQGRWYSRWGRPRDWPSVLRALFVTGRTSRGPPLARTHSLYTDRLQFASSREPPAISSGSRLPHRRSVRLEKKGRRRGRRPIGAPSPFEGEHSTEGNQRSRRRTTPSQPVPSCLPKPAPFSVPVPTTRFRRLVYGPMNCRASQNAVRIAKWPTAPAVFPRR